MCTCIRDAMGGNPGKMANAGEKVPRCSENR